MKTLWGGAWRTDLVPSDAKGRIEFVGHLAPDAIRQKYLIRDVSSYTKISLQAPCLYINEPRPEFSVLISN